MSRNQPSPKPGKLAVASYVLRDIEERVEMGRKKYGSLLQTHNGRDALWDAYCEAIDMVMYLRQAILERSMEDNMEDNMVVAMPAFKRITKRITQVSALRSNRPYDFAESVHQATHYLLCFGEYQTDSTSGDIRLVQVWQGVIDIEGLFQVLHRAGVLTEMEP